MERQLAQQDRMGEREPDPDDREDGDRHRPGHVRQGRPQQREDEHHREERDEGEQDLKRAAEERGRDHPKRRDEGGGLERLRAGGHPEELDLRRPGQADHGRSEDAAAGDDDDDREDDPRDRPEQPGERLRSLAAGQLRPRGPGRSRRRPGAVDCGSGSAVARPPSLRATGQPPSGVRRSRNRRRGATPPDRRGLPRPSRAAEATNLVEGGSPSPRAYSREARTRRGGAMPCIRVATPAISPSRRGSRRSRVASRRAARGSGPAGPRRRPGTPVTSPPPAA